ncbi:MAG: acyl-CoA dehydrogenase family protein [Pirellulales bacterium]
MTTVASPIEQALGGSPAAVDGFRCPPDLPQESSQAVLERSLATVRRLRDEQRLYDAHGKVAPEVLAALARDGYWGLRIPRAYGGSELPWRSFYPFLSQLAAVSATVAGLASVHGCIGAGGALTAFGTEQQRRRWLPELARGERWTAFALTEPQAGSDLTALRTRAVRQGDSYEIWGEKVFISNLDLGRTIVLICQIAAEPAALICELPTVEDATFRLRDYGLHALRRSGNRGAEFRGLRVPVEARLQPPRGNGLTVAYHGLNRGRVAVCAVAAGQLRALLGSLIPWVTHRATYGAPLAERELVQRRLARLAALIVGCDSLSAWCGGLLDAGVRGEMECTTAKVFGSEALKEAAIELAMKTHGGRAFLRGHLWGDNLHDYLTPCIYEGEGELLSLAMFRPLAKAVQSPSGSTSASILWAGETPAIEGELAAPVAEAWQALAAIRSELSEFLRSAGEAAIERQCQVVDLVQRVQKLVTLLVVAHAAGTATAEIERQAALVLVHDLAREVAGRRAGPSDWARATRLGAALAAGGWQHWIADPLPPLLHPGGGHSC